MRRSGNPHPVGNPRASGAPRLSGSSAEPDAFAPSDVSGLKLWLDAAQITGLMDGAAVATWSDLSGGGNHATQATGTKQPTYKTGIRNGLPVVRFDGGDGLAVPAIDLTASTGLTVAAVVNSTVNGVLQAIYEYSTNVALFTDGFILYKNSTNPVGVQHKGDAGLSNFTTTDALGATHSVIVGLYDKTLAINEVSARINGAAAPGTYSTNQNNTGTYGNRTSFVGSRDTSSLFLTGDIAELLVYGRVLAADDLAQLETYLRSKWGIA